MPSLTQTSIENVTFGRMATLLKYVGTGAVNSLVQDELLGLLEDFESSSQDIELFAALASRLEAKGWQPGQVKKVVDLLATARQTERKELRERVTVAYNPVFIGGGLQTASRVLEQGTGKLLQAWIFTNGQADASISLYDSPDLSDIQASSFLFRVSCPGGALVNSDSFKEELGFTALTAILTGAGASYSVLYRTLERGTGEKK